MVQEDHDRNDKKEAEAEQLLQSDLLDENGPFGDPQLLPRVGHEFQAEIPPIILESERFHILINPVDTGAMVNASHSFHMGLPVPVMWVPDSTHNCRNEEVFNRSVESKTRRSGQIYSSEKDCEAMVKHFNCVSHHGKDKKAENIEYTTRCSEDQISKSKGYRPLPNLACQSWSDLETESFVLGLYIFGKNLVQVKKFVESKDMGGILYFYYGKFYGSDSHRRWMVCKKMRKKKRIIGEKIFTGWRQQELVSRLIPHAPKDSQKTLVEVSKTFAEGRISLEEYVFSLRTTVGICALIEAVGIGKGKEDLTGQAMEPLKANHVFTIGPKIPIGKACSSLTSKDIIKILTEGFRLSKAKSTDLFWEAVWPRLLARGWHSEQPKNQFYGSSKDFLVFLVPGIKKFSRRKLVKGDHYFDSITDVLSKVISEPKLLDIEDDNEYVKPSSSRPETDNLSNRHRFHYLKPRVSTSSAKSLKFTVVDTSLADMENSAKVRELRRLPTEIASTYDHTSSQETRADSSEESTDEPDLIDESLDDQKCRYNPAHADDISDGTVSNPRQAVNSSRDLNENPHFVNTVASNKKQQSKQRVKHGNFNYPAPTKRRRLDACAKVEARRASEIPLARPKQDDPSMLDSLDARDRGASPVAPSALSVSPVKGHQEEESCAGTINDSCISMDTSNSENGKPEKRPLIDLNLPHIPPEFYSDEPSGMEDHDERMNVNANCSFSSSNKKEVVEDSEALRTKVDDSKREQQLEANPRRFGTRIRPPTTRALEALASGFLSTKQKQKSVKLLTENLTLRPSRRARSRLPITLNCEDTGSAILNMKEGEEVDGGSGRF